MRRLLIRSGAIGDCIVALPVMQFLKTSYTEVWVPSAIAPLVRFANAVYSIASTGLERVGIGESPPDGLRQRLSAFDEIISWYGASRPEFRADLLDMNPRSVFHPALPQAESAEHVTDFLARQVGVPCGLQPRVAVRRQSQRAAIVIHPFSGSVRKNWPLARYRELAERLPYPVEWLAGPDDTLSGAQRFDDLGELATWLGASRAYIGNDSGVTHLAAATGVSTIALFGPASSAAWVPRGHRVCVVEHSDLETIRVDEVLRGIAQLADGTL